MSKKALCQTKQHEYKVTYPQAVKFAEDQFNIAWPPTEYAVEEDIRDVYYKCSEAEKHGIIETLRLFTHYELRAGTDYWLNKVMKKYPRVCIQRMASAFGNAELNYHAPFYSELNKALMLDTPEFYSSYKDDPILKERMEFIDKIIRSDDDLLSLGAFSMVEGAVLYSSFAFLKSFRANGNNKFKNIVAGINASASDENLHALGGAWLFGQHASELGIDVKAEYEEKLHEVARKIYEHEQHIIKLIFSKGSIPGITEKQLDNFVLSRLNICLQNLGLSKLEEVKYNPIAGWFYDNINAVRLHDFFQASGSEYTRDWVEEEFMYWGGEKIE